MMLKRGMLPWRADAIKLRMRDALNAPALPVVPKTFGHVAHAPAGGWGMLGNGPDPTALQAYRNGVGNCVLAGAAHSTMVECMATGRSIPHFSGANIDTQYFSLTSGQDIGLDPISTAAWLQKIGLLDADGIVHKIRAYGSVDPDDIDLTAFLFGTCGLALNLPDTAEAQFNAHEPWDDVTRPPGSGHFIPLAGRNSKGVRFVVTWGTLQGISDAYIDKYWAGGLCRFSEEYLLTTGVSPEAFDTAKLDALLAELSTNE
jgi:hypothetical protein